MIHTDGLRRFERGALLDGCYTWEDHSHPSLLSRIASCFRCKNEYI